MVVRTAAFFSPDDSYNFAIDAVARLRRGEPLRAAQSVVSPTYVPDLCHSVLDLLIDAETGLWHLSNDGAVSWAEFAERIAMACGLDSSLVERVSGEDLGWTAPRPERCALASERGSPMPSLDGAIERFAQAVA
jgi:dTDP-4-dehydrorhamnose reductase